MRFGISGLFCSVLFTFACSSLHSQDLTVGGIAIRSSYTDAVQILKSKGLEVTPVTVTENADTAKLAHQDYAFAGNNRKGPPLQVGDTHYSILALNGKVLDVSYRKTFAVADAPNTQTTLEDLRKKWGPESQIVPSYGSIQLVWNFDSNGKAHPRLGTGSFRDCEDGVSSIGVQTPQSDAQLGVPRFLPRIPDQPACSVGILVYLYPNSKNPQLLDSFRETIVDNDALGAYNTAFYHVVKARVDGIDADASKRKAPL